MKKSEKRLGWGDAADGGPDKVAFCVCDVFVVTLHSYLCRFVVLEWT